MIDYINNKVRERADKRFMDKVERRVTEFLVSLIKEFGDIYQYHPGEDLYKWEKEGDTDDLTHVHLHYDELKSNGEPLCRISIPPLVVYKNNKWIE